MSDHRHSTDQVKTVVSACPEGCQSYELETEGGEEAVDELVETVTEVYDECSDCGAEMGVMRKDEPAEVLE